MIDFHDISNPFMHISIMIALGLGILAEIGILIALFYGMFRIIRGIFIRHSQKGLFK